MSDYSYRHKAKGPVEKKYLSKLYRFTDSERRKLKTARSGRTDK